MPRLALGLCLVGAPLLLNGALGLTSLLIAAACLLCLALALPRAGEGPGPHAAVGAVALVAVALSALAALPLPAAWTAWLAPEAHQAALEAAASLGLPPPRFIATSLDPGGSRERSLAAVAVAAAFLAGSMAASRRRVFAWGAASVGAVILVTLAHQAAGASAVYGTYVPSHAGARLVSPLMNPNHLGGFAAFGALLALGLALEASRPGPRLAAGALAAAAAALTGLCASRGAVGALVLGLVALVALRARAGGGRRALGAALGLGTAALALGALGGLATLTERLARGDYDKLAVQARASALLLERPLLGLGRGSFSVAALRSLPSELRYTHPESLPLQWGIEWGLPFTLVALAITVGALGRVALTTRSPARAGAVVAVLALGAQNLVDFGLEMSGVAVVVAAVAGAALAQRAPGGRRLAALTLAAGALLLPAFGPSVVRGGGLERGLAMEAALAAGEPTRALEGLEEASRLHPAEPLLPLYAAAAGLETGDPRTAAWLNRAMRLAPGWAAPHRLAARYLLARGAREQAALEWRQAETRRPGSAVDEACAALPPDAPLRLAEAAAPAEPEAARAFLEALGGCLPLEAPLTRAIDARLREAPGEASLGAARRVARRALLAGDAEAALEALGGAEDSASVTLRAAALSALGRREEAQRALEGLEEHSYASLQRLAALSARLGDEAALEGALARYRGLLAREGLGPARASLLEGDLRARQGDTHRALMAYRRAEAQDPSLGAAARAEALRRRQATPPRAIE